MSTRRMPRAQVRDQEDESVEDNIRYMHVTAAEQATVADLATEDEKEYSVRENMVMTAFKVAKPYLLVVNSVAGIYILWMVLHFVSANLYVYYCAHMSLFGFLMSPVLASAPHCRAIRWVLNSGTHSIDAMWIVLGTWVCSKLALIGGATPAPAPAPVTVSPHPYGGVRVRED
jgi:hypothetical protein